MSSIDIYEILSSKPHNAHFLRKYFNFLETCREKNRCLDNSTYTEKHHICPKAKDLFPEYKNFKEFPWNLIVLTARQHFIAHWMLWRSYGKSQAYAFHTLNTQARKTSNQIQRYAKKDSTSYALAKEDAKQWISEKSKGKAAYRDKDGNKLVARTDDPRVISGELISCTKGRVHRKHTEEKSKERREIFRKLFKDVPVYRSMYFLTMKIKVNVKSDLFINLLDQGWSSNATREYISSVSSRTNINRYEKKTSEALLNCDYSKYRILYDEDQQCFLSGDPLIWERNSSVRKIVSNKKFKTFKDQLTGIIYQVKYDTQIPSWFIPVFIKTKRSTSSNTSPSDTL